MRILRSTFAAIALTGGIAISLAAQVIVQSSYRPPEMVQRVVLPVDPKEQRLKILIISGQNSYEHDRTGVNNLLRQQFQDTRRFDVDGIQTLIARRAEWAATGAVTIPPLEKAAAFETPQ